MSDVAAVELTHAEFEERRRWALKQGLPFYFWPDLPRASWHAALAQVGRVAAGVLRGDAGVRLERPETVPDGVWPRALTTAAFTSGMGPLLGWWQQRAQLSCDADTAQLLNLQLAHSRDRAARMDDALRQTEATLRAAGLELTLLKGSHTARYCFPEPGVRPMSDHDVLVENRDVARAERALLEAGYTLIDGSRVPRPYRSTWRPPGAPDSVRSLSVHHAENPFMLDLHTSLAVDFMGVRTVRWRPVGPARAAAPWPDSSALVVRQPLLVAHIAAHASLTMLNLTLLRLTELVLLLQRDAGSVFEWAELRELLRRSNAERFVYPAFELAERFVPSTVEPALRERLARAATPALRRIVAQLTPASAHRVVIAVDEMFMWGTTPLEHLRRVAYSVLPPAARSPRLLARIYRDRAARLARGRLPLRP